MRITGIRVDGYGVFSGLEIDELPAGLTVVVGSNEAGKSTLLDFVRGVLFGFPDRRSRASYHEPLRGGRHGGAVRLADREGRHYVVERHLDSHGLEVYGPDGDPLDARRLTALLGGADEALYRSVFAFGLGELATFESLDRDEIRDLVFSAGVLGAGRSATRAGQVLEQRRAAIVRPRRQDAIANALQHRLEDLDGRLRQARHAAQNYSVRLAERELLAEEVASARDAAEAFDRRARVLDQITLCWPIHVDRRAAVERLAALPPLGEEERALLGEEAELRRLHAASSGHEERRTRHDDLSGQLAGIDDRLAALHAEIGLAPGAGLVRRDVALEARAAEIHREHGELVAARSALDDQFVEARADLREAIGRSEATNVGPPVRDERALADLALDLNELRRLLRDRDEERLATLVRPVASELRQRRVELGPLGTGLVALLVAATVLSSVASHGHLVPLVLGSLSIAALLVTWVIASRATRTKTAVDRQIPPGDDRTSSIENTIAARAEQLGLGPHPSSAAVETCGERLELERADRRHIDEAQRLLDAARRRYGAARERIALQSARISALEDEASTLGQSLGIGAVGPRGLLDGLELLGRIEALLIARSRVLDGLSALSGELSQFEHALSAVELRVTGCHSLTSIPALERAASLADRMDTAVSRARARAELEETILTADTFLANSLGSGPNSSALRAELERADLLSWQAERDQIEACSREATLRSEAARDALHEAERQLGELVDSSEIADLELERAAVATALDGALSDWLAFGLAHAFLDRTLARYERERQPRVIALAAELFQEVTDGRYIALVAREANEPGRRHGIDAIGRSGERVPAGDLSRGTAEQLYLCLRLAFAATFSEQATSLPLVLDDVLVNFDPARAAAMARVVARVAEDHQVLAFTCHPHIAERFTEAATGLCLVELSPVAGLVGA